MTLHLVSITVEIEAPDPKTAAKLGVDMILGNDHDQHGHVYVEVDDGNEVTNQTVGLD